MTRSFTILLLCALGAAAGPATADAQLRDLIKKKVTSAVTGEKTNGNDAKAYQVLGFKEGQQDMLTEEAVEDFNTAVKEEIRLRKELRQQLLAYKSPQQYQACAREFEASPEAQKIMLSFSIPDNATVEQLMQAQQKLANEKMAAQQRKCGPDINTEWPVAKRQARVSEIRKAGEAAFREARAARAARDEQEARTGRTGGGPSVEQLPVIDATDDPDDFYNWMWDIVKAFCKSLDDGLIVRNPSGDFEFGFSHPKPFSHFMTQREASALHAGCVYVKTHDELLDLLEIQR